MEYALMATMIEEFNGNSLNRDNWPVLYGGEANGYSWSHDDVKVGNGQLTVSMTNHGGWWSAGGISQGWNGGTYGHFEIRARVDDGQGTGAAILLWPTNNSWPPEIDLMESPNADRSTVTFSKHWDGGGGSDWSESQTFNIDASDWHTYTLDWQPGWMSYSIDGKQLYTTTEHVPNQAMSLAFMGFVAKPGDHWYGGGPNGSTPGQVSLHVDYVRITDGSSSAPVAAPAPVVPAPVVVTAPEIVAAPVQEFVPVIDTTPVVDSVASSEPSWMVNGQIDWNAWAAQLQINYELTGTWWI